MHDVGLVLRQFEHVVLFFGPLNRVARFGRYFHAVHLFQLGFREECLVRNTIPACVVGCVDGIGGFERILRTKNVNNMELSLLFYPHRCSSYSPRRRRPPVDGAARLCEHSPCWRCQPERTASDTGRKCRHSRRTVCGRVGRPPVGFSCRARRCRCKICTPTVSVTVALPAGD